MGKAVAVLIGVVIAGLALSVLLVNLGSHHSARVRPAVTPAALARRGYPGWVRRIAMRSPIGFYYGRGGTHRHPRVVSVSFRHGSKADRLIVVFDREVVCGPCSYPQGGRPPLGTRLGVTYAPRSHQMLGFSFG